MELLNDLCIALIRNVETPMAKAALIIASCDWETRMAVYDLLEKEIEGGSEPGKE